MMRRIAGFTAVAGLVAAALAANGCAACPGMKTTTKAETPVVKAQPTGPMSIEISPVSDVNPVRTQHTFVATVRDANGTPVPGARVEWILARGPQLVGDIVDVDGGKKVDNFYAVSTTGSRNVTIDRGNSDASDDIVLGAGQTWCTITSTVEGTSNVVAYAPAIANWDHHKAFAEKNWMDVTWEWPTEATNRVGTPHDFVVKLMRYSDGSPYAGWQVNYRLLSGPEGTLSAQSVTTDAQGVAKSTLTQNASAIGTNDVEITIIRPAKKDDCVCYPEKLIWQGVVRKNWVDVDVAIQKMAPARASVGQAFAYDIAVTNLANLELRGVTVSDRLPDGIEYVSSTPAATVSGQDLSWNLGTMAPASVQTLQVMVKASRKGSFENCAEVKAEDGRLNKRSCAVTEVVAPAVKIEKYATPDTLVCDPISYRIVVRNDGDGAAEDVRVTDALPEGVTTRDGRTAVEFGPVTLAPGQSQEFTFEAMAAKGGNYTNTAKLMTAAGAGDEASASTLVRECKLQITKVAKRADIKSGRPATFDITVTNTGDADARDLVVEDSIPSGTTFSSATDSGVVSGDRVVWNLGTLAAGASRTVGVTLSTTSAGTFSNTATARAYCCQDVSSTAKIEVKGQAAVLLEVVDVSDPIEVGGQETYEITVTNQGTADDTNIVIAATLPNEMKFISANTADAQNVSFQVSGQSIKFAPVASLAPKAKLRYLVVAEATAVGDLRFAVQLDSDVLDTPVNETESTHVY